MRTDAKQGILMNIVVGIVARCSQLPARRLLRRRRQSVGGNRLDGGTLLAAFVGGVLLLAVINLFRARRPLSPFHQHWWDRRPRRSGCAEGHEPAHISPQAPGALFRRGLVFSRLEVSSRPGPGPPARRRRCRSAEQAAPIASGDQT